MESGGRGEGMMDRGEGVVEECSPGMGHEGRAMVARGT